MTVHTPVLLKEAIENLNLKNGDVVVDATLGGGGHSREILKAINNEGLLVAIDSDIQAISSFAELPITNFQLPDKFQIQNSKFKILGNVCLVHDNFRNLSSILKELKIEKVDAILADFGISSDQLESGRGFSFQKDTPLDMRMSEGGGITAEEIINTYPEEKLIRIFEEYGEERFAKKITRELIEQRKVKPLKTTFDLVSIVQSAVPERYMHQKIHPATKVFQALRMEVNEELDSIRTFIQQAIDSLDTSGRLAVITFHSGEDVIAKNMFRENARGCICPSTLPVCVCGRKPTIRIVTKKPIVPGSGEIGMNPRSRSAKLRVIEKI